MRQLIVVAMALCVSMIASSQEEGVSIQLVERIPMGDGTMVYRYATGEKKHLQGECRLAVNEREYIIADFKDGFPDGKWETFRYNKLYEKRNYKKGRLNGQVTTYASDGKTVVAESTSSEGKRNGRYTIYYTNGQLSKEQEFKDGKEHGYLRTYDQDGTIKWDCNYEDGKMHGQQTQLFVSNLHGYFVKTSNYEHGVLVGDYSEVFENGNIKEKGQYDKKGKKTGIWIAGNKDGSLADESEYENGERNGIRKSFFDDNTVSKVQTYKNGILEGLSSEYNYKTHQLERETNYVDGRKEGPFKVYHEDGKTIKIEGEYLRGNVIKQKQYHANGKLYLVQEKEGNSLKTLEKYDENGKRL